MAERFFTRSIDPEMEKKMLQEITERVRKALHDAIMKVFEEGDLRFDEDGANRIVSAVQDALSRLW